MKRLIAVMVCLLLPLLCLAEGMPDFEGILSEEGEYLRRYIAPDGQEIMYTSMSDDEYVYAEDVNFDGVDDLVALTMLGASNCGYTFFVSTPDGYQLVMTDEMMYNYQLLPGQQAVMTDLDEGWAGALCRMAVYVWDGYELRLVRTAVSEADETREKLRMSVTDLTGAEPFIVWQAEVPALAEDAVRVEIENMRKALIDGYASAE